MKKWHTPTIVSHEFQAPGNHNVRPLTPSLPSLRMVHQYNQVELQPDHESYRNYISPSNHRSFSFDNQAIFPSVCNNRADINWNGDSYSVSSKISSPWCCGGKYVKWEEPTWPMPSAMDRTICTLKSTLCCLFLSNNASELRSKPLLIQTDE